jgi:hypothetical protein
MRINHYLFGYDRRERLVFELLIPLKCIPAMKEIAHLPFSWDPDGVHAYPLTHDQAIEIGKKVLGKYPDEIKPQLDFFLEPVGEPLN